MGAADNTCVKQQALAFLTDQGFRLTAQRRTIVEAAFSTREHFTADQLLAWSQTRDPSVSRATVYRTLPLLTESGLIREMDFGKDRKFYDPNYARRPNHNHIICQECDRIVEFESERIAELESEISVRLGFTVKSRRLQITGSCEELRQSGTCKNKPPKS